MDRAFGARALFPQHEKSAKGCRRGKLLRKLIREEKAKFEATTPTPEQVARRGLIEAGRTYCIARCGGCEITSAMRPPT